jgi:hypothetical protein
MEDKPKLPIEKLTIDEFSEFKKKYLDNDILTLEDINEIKKLFKLSDETTAILACDEMHGHSYRCIHYFKPRSGIVERLLGEIEHYKSAIEDIENTVKKYK